MQPQTNHGPEWLDIRFVTRLLRRRIRPGLINLAQAEAIIARCQGMTGSLSLAERLNHRWLGLDDETTSVPIVYARPNPIIVKVDGKETGKGKRPRSVKNQGRSRAKNKSAEHSRPVSSSTSKSTGAESRNTVTQRKVSSASSTSSMPVVKPTIINTISNITLGRDGKAKTSETAEASSAATNHTLDASDQHAMTLDIAPGAVEPPSLTRMVQPSPVAIPVVSPQARVESLLIGLQPIPGPGSDGAQPRAGDSGPRLIVGEQVAPADGPEELAGASIELPQVNPALYSNQTAARVYPLPRVQPTPGANPMAPSVPLPIVHEEIVSKLSWQRVNQQQPLPLTIERTPAVKPAVGQLNQLGQSEVFSADAGQKMQPIQRVSTSQNETGRTDTAQPAPGNIDIDEIVNKVQRRFMRRLAIEGERRGTSRWR